MNFNPYEPPRPGAVSNFASPQPIPVVNRTPFVLAALGAWAASGYWALMLLLGAVGVASGAGSSTGLILPLVLIVLYASRGLQLYKGDPAAIRRIMWLHGFGAVAAIIQVLQLSGIVAVLQGLKVVINVFGICAALWAHRTLQRAAIPAPLPVAPAPYGNPR
jgi:hypothetical protein